MVLYFFVGNTMRLTLKADVAIVLTSREASVIHAAIGMGSTKVKAMPQEHAKERSEFASEVDDTMKRFGQLLEQLSNVHGHITEVREQAGIED